MLAGLHKQQHGYDEVILLDQRGYVAECVASSLFWQKDNQWFTPSLDTGCIDGILRRQLLRTWPVQEGLFRPDDVFGADSVFCANVAGVQALLSTSATVVKRDLETFLLTRSPS